MQFILVVLIAMAIFVPGLAKNIFGEAVDTTHQVVHRVANDVVDQAKKIPE